MNKINFYTYTQELSKNRLKIQLILYFETKLDFLDAFFRKKLTTNKQSQYAIFFLHQSNTRIQTFIMYIIIYDTS